MHPVSRSERIEYMVNACRPHTVLITVFLASIGGSATADTSDGGYYLKVFGGVSSVSDTDLDGLATNESGFDTGQIFGGAVGYAFAGSPFRSELEYAYRTGDADGSAGITGDLASTTVALNGYYDFTPVAGGLLTPYVGVGLSYVTEIDFDVSGGLAPGEYTDRDGFGYQLMLGAEYPLSERWSINGEVRYFDAGSQTLTGSGGKLSADYQTLELLIGTAFTS